MHGFVPNVVPRELQLKSDWNTDRERAFENSANNFRKNKERIDKNRREWEFNDGDWVYIKSANKLNRKKLDEIRKGPFKVVKRISDSCTKSIVANVRKKPLYFTVTN